MTKPLVVFDGDDTLWFVEHLYDAARGRAAAIVESTGLDPAEWSSLQKAIDVQNAHVLGVSVKRFPLSSSQAYERLARSHGITPSKLKAAAIQEAAASVFRASAPAAPGARQAIIDLSASYRLALLTKGDRRVQEKRIADSGLSSFFEHINIVDDKNEASFAEILAQCNAAAPDAWSVGNSLPSDINPALRVGMSAIWIEADVWEHERRELEPASGRLFVARSLIDVGAILEKQAPHHARRR